MTIRNNLPDFDKDIYGRIIAFDGNKNLKPAGTELSLTKEHIEEILKCSDDIIYFAENYYYIITLDEGKRKIQLYDFQRELLRRFSQNRFNIVVASRQVGKTTTYAIFSLWYSLFHSDKTIGILANKEATAIEILSRIRIAYEMLPKWLQQGIVSFNKKGIELENGSRILSFATASSLARSYSMNVVILDEFAFLPTNLYEDFKSSVFPVISSSKNSKIIIVSTYNGINHFYKMYKEAEEGKSAFVPYKITWRDVPSRDEEWAKAMKKTVGEEAFKEEFDCIPRTVASDKLLIPSEKLLTYEWKNSLIIPNELQEVFSNYEFNLKIYEYVQPNHIYSIGVDTSRMTSKEADADALSVVVLDVTQYPLKVVAKFYTERYFDYRELPEVINALGKYYNNAVVFIENNDVGVEVANLLISDQEYTNVYTEKPPLPGFRTTKKTKKIGINNLKSLLLQDNLILNDYELIEQLAYFEKKPNGTYAAASGKKDDAVMSLIAALFFLQDKDLKFLPENKLEMSINKNKERMEELQIYNKVLFGDELDNEVNYEDLEMMRELLNS